MLRAAMLSFWHVHAGGYANEFNSLPDCKVTAVWDEVPERGADWAKRLDVPFEADLAAILRRDDVDCVIVDAPTNRHAEVMIAAAAAKKHIFTEKVLALTVAECDQIAQAVREHGVTFTISLPQRGSGAVQFAKQAIERGWLGDVQFIRARNAHSGVSGNWLPPHFLEPVGTGGGALIDIGAHPVYTISHLMGRPQEVSAMLLSGYDKGVDDNAVATIAFEKGALGVVEAGFVSAHSLNTLEIFGTKGTLFSGGPNGEVRFISDVLESQVKGWITPQLPRPLPSPMRQWVASIRDGEPVRYGLEDGRKLTELMQAATVASREQRTVRLPL
ncbi:MAG TPA: Gfo/Idh/MocA family oxidoreductase [Limnochordia bacterium]|nr:Gfo/Idh/MocA family oxidoreductase [Limnochordia bacterium]